MDPLAILFFRPVTWDQVRELAGRLGAGRLTADLLPWLSPLQLIGAAAILVVTSLAAGVFHGVTRARISEAKRAEKAGPGADPTWLRLVLEQARPPLFLMVATAGAYGALFLVVFRLPEASALLSGLDWIGAAIFLAAGIRLFYRLVGVVQLKLSRWAVITRSKWDEIVLAVAVRALRMAVPLGVLLVGLPALQLPARYHAVVQTLASMLLIGGIGFILIKLASEAEQAVSREYRIDVADNLATRKLQTQVSMLRRIVVAIVALMTASCMLMVIPSVRHVGTSLLASAGLAGIVLGLAAQKSLGNLIAGMQLAFTQPIRVDDVVVIEGDWGRIEEIALTYVVVRIWDLRRLIVPITYFVENPIENWTRTGSQILGTVFFYLDYLVPVEAMRAELDRILAASKRWDKQVSVLQVTDIKERTVEIRILVSAVDSSIAWDLRCEVREKMLDFLQRLHREALPRERIALPPQAPAGSPPDASLRAPAQS